MLYGYKSKLNCNVKNLVSDCCLTPNKLHHGKNELHLMMSASL